MTDAKDFYAMPAQTFIDQYRNDPDFIHRYKLWTGLIDKYSPGRKSALDIGCGSGLFSFFLAEKGLSVTGVDASEEMIARCEKLNQSQKSPGPRFVRENFPFGPQTSKYGPVDIIVCSSVLEYVPLLQESIQEIFQLLNRNGVILVSFPNRTSLYRKYERLLYRLIGKPAYLGFVRNQLTLKEGMDLFSKFGLSLVESSYYGHNNLISQACRRVLGPRYSENLFLMVLRKN